MHAIAAARTPADRTALLGDDEVQLWMEQLEDRMVMIASNAGRYMIVRSAVGPVALDLMLAAAGSLPQASIMRHRQPCCVAIQGAKGTMQG